MAKDISIIIPTKDRAGALKDLLNSIRQVSGLNTLALELIVGDNDSADSTWDILLAESKHFPCELRPLKVKARGKSAVLNTAIRAARGEILVFIDDDVVVDHDWLQAIANFFEPAEYQVGQGVIRIVAPERQDPKFLKLLQRYRTIPWVDYNPSVKNIHSLNGANMVINRKIFEWIGRFDERLGPGVSGTSEDVELARRIRRAGIQIGYIRDAIVYHRADWARLTEDYFKLVHKRQGKSRLLIEDRGFGRVSFDFARAALQYGYYSLVGRERDLYRSKGRMFHYYAMLEIKWNRRATKG